MEDTIPFQSWENGYTITWDDYNTSQERLVRMALMTDIDAREEYVAMQDTTIAECECNQPTRAPESKAQDIALQHKRTGTSRKSLKFWWCGGDFDA